MLISGPVGCSCSRCTFFSCSASDSAAYTSISRFIHFQHAVSKVTLPACISLVKGERPLEMGKFHYVHVLLLELSQMAAPGGLGSVVWLASLEIECGRQALSWCQVTLSLSIHALV